MAAGATYTPIASTTIGTAVASYTFSSISGSYTDLVLIASVQLSASGQSFNYQYNGDTNTNYSLTILKGNGTSATSDRRSSINYQLAAGWDAGLPSSGSSYATAIININNYSNSTTYKTSICRGSNAAGGDVTSTVCLWRNTAAITSITCYSGASANLAVGTTLALYGIVAA
jgi:hypothetical protein